MNRRAAATAQGAVGEWLLILFVTRPDGRTEMRNVPNLGSAAHCARTAELEAAGWAAKGWRVVRHQCLRVGVPA